MRAWVRAVTGETKSFWRSMSGLITAITALVTAVGGLIAILIQVGVIGGGGGTPNAGLSSGGQQTTSTQGADWADHANDICARANDLITALPNPRTLDPQVAFEMGQQALRINRQMVRELAKLPKPEPQRARVEALLRLGAQINDNAEELLADGTNGNIADIQQRQRALSRLGQKFDGSAIDLGATTCAEGSSFSGGLPSG